MIEGGTGPEGGVNPDGQAKDVNKEQGEKEGGDVEMKVEDAVVGETGSENPNAQTNGNGKEKKEKEVGSHVYLLHDQTHSQQILPFSRPPLTCPNSFPTVSLTLLFHLRIYNSLYPLRTRNPLIELSTSLKNSPSSKRSPQQGCARSGMLMRSHL